MVVSVKPGWTEFFGLGLNQQEEPTRRSADAVLLARFLNSGLVDQRSTNKSHCLEGGAPVRAIARTSSQNVPIFRLAAARGVTIAARNPAQAAGLILRW